MLVVSASRHVANGVHQSRAGQGTLGRRYKQREKGGWADWRGRFTNVVGGYWHEVALVHAICRWYSPWISCLSMVVADEAPAFVGGNAEPFPHGFDDFAYVVIISGIGGFF
jgi:hypothetical protein